MRPAFADKVIVTSEVIKVGKMLAISEVTVTDDKNIILAKIISAMYAIGKKV